MYTNIVNISGYNNAQLTQLQQINNKLDIVNWSEMEYLSFDGFSTDMLSYSLSNANNISGSVYFRFSVNNLYITNDVLYYIRVPYSINFPSRVDSVTFVYNNRDDIVINELYYNFLRTSFDVYFNNSNNGSNLRYIIVKVDINTRSNLTYYYGEFIKYINQYSNDFWDLKQYFTIFDISNKLDNIEVSVDTSDIVDAINALDITQDIDVDLSQDITQTTNLITQLRNLFGTGVTIPQFVQQTQDQSFLGWFSQSNSDNINHISTGYNEAPY